MALEQDHSRDALRVLVIEDETLIGILLEDMISELGASFVGPFTSLAAALEAAHRDDFDVALIDMNLGGERADEVARLLARRSIPFALVSGDPGMALELGQTDTLPKPFTFDDIGRVIGRLREVAAKR